MESYQMHKKDDLCRREKKKEGAAMYREHTKTIKIGNQVIGGGHPVLIQSMTNTKTEDVAATVAQILTLEKADHPLCCADDGGCKSTGRDQKANSYSSGSRHSF